MGCKPGTFLTHCGWGLLRSSDGVVIMFQLCAFRRIGMQMERRNFGAGFAGFRRSGGRRVSVQFGVKYAGVHGHWNDLREVGFKGIERGHC